MKKQVEKHFYDFSKYCDQDRWSSYWHQLNEILKHNPSTVLEVGVGNNIISSYLKNNSQIKYTSLDIASDLNPDIVASVNNIPLDDNSHDVVCAFEVLEHLPFDKFNRSINELGRVSKKYIIISLPHWGRHFSVDIRIPFFKRLHFQHKINIFPIEHKFNGQHYWEIWKRHYSISTVKKKIKSAGLRIVDDYIAFNSPYHHFFILKKNS